MSRFRSVLHPLAIAVAAAMLADPIPLAAEDALETVGTAPEVEEFGDWSVSCDNSGRCEAIGLSRALARHVLTREWGEAAFHMLRVTRDAGPAARPRVFVDRRVWGMMPSDTRTKLMLHVLDSQNGRVGKAYRLLALKDGMQEVDPRDVDAFLSESVKTTEVATRHTEIQGIASTKGMTAALRYMDESQGRRGNATAIYAKGPLPAASVVPARMPPRVKVIRGARTAAARDVTDEKLRKRGLLICGVMAAPHSGASYALANGDRLWRVDCGEEDVIGSPRNQRSVWFFERPNGEKVFPDFPRPEQGRAALRAYLPNSSFDPATGLLTATHYYSDHKDCGWRRQWGWNGTAWQLVSGRELHGCLGVMPENWLITWRAMTHAGAAQ